MLWNFVCRVLTVIGCHGVCMVFFEMIVSNIYGEIINHCVVGNHQLFGTWEYDGQLYQFNGYFST
ncbi:hypothetical protein EDB82DRAFT_117665 [Fusarium venenatum]|uniref:uncharacterized protein n=1 Tax=Fusarium venenatum TaxID=56646 RepID=UPI001D7E55BA|nr:hypothetical protein EDB82DRAFT_117665 [Fusarium venenatum]